MEIQHWKSNNQFFFNDLRKNNLADFSSKQVKLPLLRQHLSSYSLEKEGCKINTSPATQSEAAGYYWGSCLNMRWFISATAFWEYKHVQPVIENFYSQLLLAYQTKQNNPYVDVDKPSRMSCMGSDGFQWLPIPVPGDLGWVNLVYRCPPQSSGIPDDNAWHAA